jgi:hypothetical protein
MRQIRFDPRTHRLRVERARPCGTLAGLGRRVPRPMVAAARARDNNFALETLCLRQHIVAEIETTDQS